MKPLTLKSSVQKGTFVQEQIHQFEVTVIRCWKRKSGNFGIISVHALTIPPHSPWDNAVFCHMTFSPNEFCVSHHTDRAPDRTLQWKRICFACNVWGLNPSGLGGHGRVWQREATHIMTPYGQEGAGWREAEEYACSAALVCPLLSPPFVGMCERHTVCVHMCVQVHLHMCSHCVWSTYKYMHKCMCLCTWRPEEDVLCIALSLSAILFEIVWS